ncbi:MAG TPA: OmpA family protein [Chthoniobacteraceae bacterium]|jgi:outer membrane protein OmpA-like peptidoglycan-associated protein|nr:OmpA family protein [Chthoniobacteraceae bacterium]
MVHYETYQSNAAEAPIMRRWVFAGLVLSLLLHAGLLVFFYTHRVEGFDAPEARIEPPPVFKMKQVSIPPMENTDKVTITEQPQGPAIITLPSDRPEVKEITIAPQIQEQPKPLFNDKPKVEASGADKMSKNDAVTRADIDKNMTNISNALLPTAVAMPRQPKINGASGAGTNSGAGDANVKIPGLGTLDKLLDAGAIRAGDKAGMPGGALFEYDSYDLRPDAVNQLRKLGTLIQRNPRATFSIEGHSDSFGSKEYNDQLSLDRAEEVKKWLVLSYNISADRIKTKGFGFAKPIVSADKSKEEQAPNRRVELVVTNIGPKK